MVGIGPGGGASMTAEARFALQSCELFCGYGEYLRLIAPEFPGVDWVETPMTREVERCRIALAEAAKGRNVAMVCSGDAGVYGMASPVLELAGAYPEVDVVVVAGVTAAQSGAAVLGAPLGHDYAVISLSDLLTPWPVIERRLDLAAAADFCLCIYNPRSQKRREHLSQACEVILRHKGEETVCGWVRNIGRQGQGWGIVPLKELGNLEADMFTTLFVGNRMTAMENGRMITPRGYRELI